MKISVIIPSYNAALTIRVTLDALIAQSFKDWEAVIIDDGSTDETAAIAKTYCKKDQRFSLIRQPNAGLSSARNTGIANANFEYLLFLDADDWVEFDFMEKFSQAFQENKDVDAIVCGWQFVLEDGEIADVRYPPDAEDMFPFFSHTCAFVVHACVFNRKLLTGAGFFDELVGFVEDWDFWQRICRTGARFSVIREALAYYRMRKGSLSRKVYQSYHDAVKMIRQGYSADPRVKTPTEQYRNGMLDDKRPEHEAWLYCWYAALCVGVGEDPEKLEEPALSRFEAEPQQLASYIFESIYRGRCFKPSQWPEYYDDHKKDVEALFDLLSRFIDISVIRSSKVELYTMIAMQMAGREHFLFGNEVLFQPLELTEPIHDVSSNAGRIILSVRLEGELLGKLTIGNDDKTLRADQIRQEVCNRWAWEVMVSYLGKSKPVPDPNSEWKWFLQEFWGLDWDEPAFYDEFFVDTGAYLTVPGRPEIRVETSRELFNVDAKDPFDVSYFIGGLFVGKVSFSGQGLVSAQAIRAAISGDARFELCRAAVYQGLIGRKLQKVNLREELKMAALVAD